MSEKLDAKGGPPANSELLQEVGSLSGLIDEITTNNRFGVADLSQVKPSFDETTPAAKGVAKDQFVTINSQGAFFNSNSSSGGKFSVDFGKYLGGQVGAKAFILLHELGHLTGALVPDFTGDAKKDQKAEDRNDKAIDANCKDSLKAITK
ncbi:MAG: hypothetical protein LAN37_07795 [Acidobacteriia bacterium]|nr:hypothetical protein [Terriglobia bacterium]